MTTISPEELFKIGVTLLVNKDRFKESLNYLLQVRSVNPDFKELNYALGCYFHKDQQFHKASFFLKKELEANPSLALTQKAVIYDHLAWSSSCLGKNADAVYYAEKLIATTPPSIKHYSTLLYMLSHCENVSDSDLSKIANNAYKNCLDIQLKDERKIVKNISKGKQEAEKSKIKLGIVSPFFYSKSVEFFLIDLFEEFNQDKFEFHFFYTDNIFDSTTEKYQKLAQSFHSCTNDNPLQIARKITEQEVDILIDTLGHSIGNHLEVFSLKPAPIQISFLGYWGSTGLPQMDYYLTAKEWIQDKDKTSFSEEIIELSKHFFKPSNKEILIKAPPCINNKFITFGCFNRGQKINSKILATWSIILNLVPDSNLVLSYPALNEEDFRNHILDFFSSQNISPTRIKLIGLINTHDYLELYNQIDIALDPFPFSGGCTSIDCLWMSVPIITLEGNNSAGKQTASFLKDCNSSELIAKTEAEYINKAVKLANDAEAIKQYKSSLRDKLIQSEIINPQVRAKEFENIFTEIFQLKQKENSLPERIPQ
jgi:predicted O-linked N-acetylglucosamine transferase (SPINDLY family)